MRLLTYQLDTWQASRRRFVRGILHRPHNPVSADRTKANNNCSISYLVSHTCTRRSRQKQPNHRILDTCRVRTTHKPLSTKHPSRSATWCHQLPGTVRGLMKRNKPQTHSSSRETCRDVERQLPAVRTSYLQFIATDNPMHHARKLCPLRPSNSRLHSSFTTSTSSTAAASRCV